MTTNGKERGVREWAASRLLRGQPVPVIANVLLDVCASMSDEQRRALAARVLPKGIHTHKSPRRKDSETRHIS